MFRCLPPSHEATACQGGHGSAVRRQIQANAEHEHRMSNAEFSRQLLTGKVTIKNPVVFGGGIGNSPGMI